MPIGMRCYAIKCTERSLCCRMELVLILDKQLRKLYPRAFVVLEVRNSPAELFWRSCFRAASGLPATNVGAHSFGPATSYI